MRRLLLVALLALAAPAFAAAPSFTEEQKGDLRRISVYLNSVHSLTAHFLQIGPDGKPQEGTFYLQKPGRLRFEYNKPIPTLVIADGYSVIVQNTALRTTDRYPLLNSPLRVLLSNDVDLVTDSRIAGVSREAGALTLIARQDSGPAQGQIAITFADSQGSLELRQWEVLDAQGLRTVIVVNGIQTGVVLAANLFKPINFRPLRPPRRQ